MQFIILIVIYISYFVCYQQLGFYFVGTTQCCIEKTSKISIRRLSRTFCYV